MSNASRDDTGTELLETEEGRSDRVLHGHMDVVSVSWAPSPGACSQVAVTAGESVVIYSRVRGWSYGVLSGNRAGWFPAYCASSRDRSVLKPLDFSDKGSRPRRRVLWDWEASDVGPFLSVNKGDHVEIVGQRGGWFRGRRVAPVSDEGWFPDYMLSPPSTVFRSAAWQMLLDAGRAETGSVLEDANAGLLHSWSALLSGHRPEVT